VVVETVSLPTTTVKLPIVAAAGTVTIIFVSVTETKEVTLSEPKRTSFSAGKTGTVYNDIATNSSSWCKAGNYRGGIYAHNGHGRCSQGWCNRHGTHQTTYTSNAEGQRFKLTIVEYKVFHTGYSYG
jgi:hypothetical protein